MNKKSLLIALGLAGSASAALAAPPALDFSGYMRAGIGTNARGGTQVCYGLPGADTKWRLGNECDYVIEPSFSAKLASYEGADWHVHFMPSVYRAWGSNEFGTPPGDDGVVGGNDELVTRFGQVYTYGNNIAALGNGKVWAGRRFYNRLQLGINDQFLENNDGDGAGLEDMNVGVGKLSVAIMMNPSDSAFDNRITVPVRLTNIKTIPNGELAVYVTGGFQTKTENQTVPGTPEPADQPKSGAIGLYHTQSGVLNGNLLIGFKHDRRGELRNTRVVAQQSSQFGATAFDGIAEYRVRDNAASVTSLGDRASKWISIGARTDTHISGPFRFLAELGHDRVDPDVGETLNLTKLTLAGAISAGNTAGSRPTVRVFVTHARWNDAAARTLDARTVQVFGDKKSGTSIGIQGETWW